MKNKILPIIIIFIIVLGIVGAAQWYLSTHKNAAEKNPATSLPGQSGQTNGQNVFANDDFSFTYPNGWQSVPPQTGVSAMIVKQNEISTDPQAKKMNFQSYMSVSYAPSDKTSKNLIIDAVKNQLRSLIPDIAFSQEKSLTINQNDAYAMEMNLNQGGINFHILMVLVWGKGNDVWILSFNTLESLWQGYADTFGEITQTFTVK
ncbi:MAG: PsbP-related protein [Candidatus Paceibacterota bacterium]